MAPFSPHETESNMCSPCQYHCVLFEHILFIVIPGGSCVWLSTKTPPKYCCLLDVKGLEDDFIQSLHKGTSKFLVSLTMELLAISFIGLCAFNQFLSNPYHLLYRSHVFHLLDNNLTLPYAMNHWMVQSVPYMATPSSSGWLTVIRHMGHTQDGWIIGTCKCSSSENPIWIGRGNCTNASNDFVWT